MTRYAMLPENRVRTRYRVRSLLEQTVVTLLMLSGVMLIATDVRADVNAKLFSTNDTAISQIGQFEDWNKRYHRVVPGGQPDQLVFYSRIEDYFRVVRLNPSGGFQSLSDTWNVGQFDEVVSGSFGGTTANQDVLFYNRSTGRARAFEISPSGASTELWDTTVPGTPQGGTWDVVAAGNLGHNGWDDLLVYNKTEGAANFYQVTSNGSALVLGATYFGFRKYWDQIHSGDFDGDGLDDFLFYNQDGGGDQPGTFQTGHAKFISFGSSYTLEVLSETFTEWPMAAHVIPVPGTFGGNDETTDFMLYDADDGSGQFWINDGTGSFNLENSYAFQRRWTSVVPLQVNGGDTDLFFFTTQVVINVVPVSVNGADLSEMQTWLDYANTAFAPAGVFFELGSPRHWSFAAEATVCDSSAVAELNEQAGIIRKNANDLIVYVVPNRGSGCSWYNRDFVVMPQWNSTSTTQRNRDGSVNSSTRNPKLFAHEVGHHFGLPHESMESVDDSLQDDPYYYDNERNITSNKYSAMLVDTPPHPHANSAFWSGVANQCDDSGGDDVVVAAPGGTYTLSPERHNAMSNGMNCDLLYRFTPNQQMVIRQNLWVDRSYADLDSIACVTALDDISVGDHGWLFALQVRTGADLALGNQADVLGSAWASGNASMGWDSVVIGDLSIGGTLAPDNGHIFGDFLSGVNVAAPTLTVAAIEPGTTLITVGNDQTYTLSPGAYGDVDVGDRGKLVLSAGYYSFNRLTFSNDARLVLDTGAGSYDIGVLQTLSFGHRFDVISSTATPVDPEDVLVYSASSAVAVGHDANVRATLKAPNAEVTLWDRADVYGCVHSQQLTLKNEAAIWEQF